MLGLQKKNPAGFCGIFDHNFLQQNLSTSNRPEADTHCLPQDILTSYRHRQGEFGGITSTELTTDLTVPNCVGVFEVCTDHKPPYPYWYLATGLSSIYNYTQ